MVTSDGWLQPCSMVFQRYALEEHARMAEEFTKNNTCDECYVSIRSYLDKTFPQLLWENVSGNLSVKARPGKILILRQGEVHSEGEIHGARIAYGKSGGRLSPPTLDRKQALGLVSGFVNLLERIDGKQTGCSSSTFTGVSRTSSRSKSELTAAGNDIRALFLGGNHAAAVELNALQPVE